MNVCQHDPIAQVPGADSCPYSLSQKPFQGLWHSPAKTSPGQNSMSLLTHRWGRTGPLSVGPKLLMTSIRKQCGRPYTEIMYLLDKGLIMLLMEHAWKHLIRNSNLQAKFHFHILYILINCRLWARNLPWWCQLPECLNLCVHKGRKQGWLDTCERVSNDPVQLSEPPNPNFRDQQMKTEREEFGLNRTMKRTIKMVTPCGPDIPVLRIDCFSLCLPQS